MKLKTEKYQSKMDEYLTKKRPYNNSKTIPEGSKSRSLKNESTHEEQQQVKLLIYENKRIQRTCISFLLITPADTIVYQSIIRQKLIKLNESYSKESLVNFILDNLKYHKITNIDNLLQINDHIFWNETAPKIITTVLNHINEISCKIRVLQTGISASTKITRLQILIILSSMFLGIFPKQQFENQTTFGELMTILENQRHKDNAQLRREKLKCIIAYLKIMADHSEVYTENVAIQRYCTFDNSILNINEEVTLSSVEIVDFSEKSIEDYYCEGVMVDFANKKIGGGILKNGCVQQEIMFSIFPQAIVAKLICPEMQDKEAIAIYGARKFSFTKGYEKSFIFDSEYFIDTEHHNYGNSVIVAIDALNCNDKSNHQQDQYSKKGIRREIIKACTGFRGIRNKVDMKMPICTGKWGCGAFNGDQDLKFIIQWLSCSISNRSMIYISSDKKKSAEYRCLAKELSTYKTNDVLSILDEYYMIRQKIYDKKKLNLFSYLKNFIL